MLLDLGLLYCAVVWGATFYLVKGAISEVQPIALVAFRFLISAACLAPWALRRREPWRHLGEAAALSAVLGILYVSQTVGLRYTTASNSGFITGLNILFVPILMYAFARRGPTRSQWAAVALTLAGLWVLTGGVRGINRGDALTLLCAAMYAGHIFGSDWCMKRGADTVLLLFHQFWMTGLACLLGSLACGLSLKVGSAGAAGTIVFLALCPTLSAFFIQMLAQKRVSPVKVALIFTLEPVFAAAFAWTLGGEAFSLHSAAGGLLIVAGMVVSELPLPSWSGLAEFPAEEPA